MLPTPAQLFLSCWGLIQFLASYRIGEVVISSGVPTVTNLEPEEWTGLVCSRFFYWEQGFSVAITGGYAGTVVTNDSTFIDLTTSAVRGNLRWSVDNTKHTMSV